MRDKSGRRLRGKFATQLKRVERRSIILGLSIFSILLGSLILGSCSQRKIPEFKGKIYVVDLDNRVIRYRYDEEVIPLDDHRVHGSTLFFIEDFTLFTDTYITRCEKWVDGVKMSTVEKEMAKQLP